MKSGRQRDLTTFQWPEIEAISNDGSMILLNSFDISTDANYRLYVQRTDGSPPVQVGEGAGTGFSPDANWVTAVDPTHPEKLSVIPTGIGETRTLRAPQGRQYVGAALLPDGKQILISTIGSGDAAQSALQDLDSGSVRSIGPAGWYVRTYVGLMFPGPSPDGRYCILTDGKNHYSLQPLDGAKGREIQGINTGETFMGWHDDSNNLFVSRPVGSDVEIYTLNLVSGQRKLWTRFSPADKTAVAGHGLMVITPDGAHYGYMVQRIYSTLFLADGLR